MLLFIKEPHTCAACYWAFQYISCYSLSWLWQDGSHNRWCFNTSHVTLYLKTIGNIASGFAFQYISCYSLSIIGPQGVQGPKGFQYISCYSLSKYKATGYTVTGRFNTSHVTLYPDSGGNPIAIHWFQYISCYSLSLATRLVGTIALSFNTSHVTLYQNMEKTKSFTNTSFNTSHVTLYLH